MVSDKDPGLPATVRNLKDPGPGPPLKLSPESARLVTWRSASTVTHTHKHTRTTSTSEPESLPPSVQVPPSALIQVRVSVHPSRGRASAHARPPSTRPCPKLHTMRPVSMPGRSRLGAARDPLRKAGGHSVGVMTARLDCSPAPALSPSWACRGGEVHTVTRTVTTSSRTPRPRQGPHQTLWEIFSNVIAQNSSWVHACDIMKTTPSRKAH